MLTWELPSARVMTSSCAGEVTAELMLISLMMKSGLYHHPASCLPSAHASSSYTQICLTVMMGIEQSLKNHL